MLLSIYLKNLRNNEFIQFLRNVLQIIFGNDSIKLQVEVQYNDLKNLVDLMDTTHKKNQGSSITEEINEIDDRRDNAIKGIVLNLNSYKKHYDKNFVNASNTLLKVVNLYDGDISRYSYQYETNAIHDIINKWKTSEECVAALITLNISEWKDKLEQENDLFNTKYMERIKEAAENSDVKVAELRDEMNEKYKKLLQFIAAFATINPSEEYTQMINLLNALIDQYQKTITLRSSKRLSTEEVQDESEPINDTTP